MGVAPTHIQPKITFRGTFQRIEPFAFEIEVEEACTKMDSWDGNLDTIEESGAALKELGELFDLTPSAFKELKDCRSNLKMLKQVWDLMSHVDFQFIDWMTTIFKNVDTDFLMEEVTKL